MSNKYIVHVTLPAELPSQWTYKAGYFPRVCHYLADAQGFAKSALMQGATSARIEWPDGRKEDILRMPSGKVSGKMTTPIRAEIFEDTRVTKGVVVELPVEAERIYIVTSQYGWGKGKTIREALSKCRMQTPRKGTAREHSLVVYRAMLAHESSTLDGLGGLTRPANIPPLALGIVA